MEKILLSMIILLLCVIVVPAAYATPVSQWQWDATTTNTDNTPVDGPVSYSMTCGTTSGTYTIISSQVTGLTMQISTVLGGQANGTYYCAVTAIDTWGSQSDFSNEVITRKTSAGFFAPSGKTPKAPGALREN